MSWHLSDDDRCQSTQHKYRKMFLDSRNVSFFLKIDLIAAHKSLGFNLAMYLLKFLHVKRILYFSDHCCQLKY